MGTGSARWSSRSPASLPCRDILKGEKREVEGNERDEGWRENGMRDEGGGMRKEKDIDERGQRMREEGLSDD